MSCSACDGEVAPADRLSTTELAKRVFLEDETASERRTVTHFDSQLYERGTEEVLDSVTTRSRAEERRTAWQELIRRGCAAVVPVFVRAVEEWRQDTIRALGEVMDYLITVDDIDRDASTLIPALIKFIDSVPYGDYRSERCTAVGLLGRVGFQDHAARFRLTEVLKQRDHIRGSLEAAEALLNIKETRDSAADILCSPSDSAHDDHLVPEALLLLKHGIREDLAIDVLKRTLADHRNWGWAAEEAASCLIAKPRFADHVVDHIRRQLNLDCASTTTSEVCCRLMAKFPSQTVRLLPDLVSFFGKICGRFDGSWLEAVNALRSFGPQAKGAIPLLLNSAPSIDRQLVEAHTKALVSIRGARAVGERAILSRDGGGTPARFPYADLSFAPRTGERVAIVKRRNAPRGDTDLVVKCNSKVEGALPRELAQWIVPLIAQDYWVEVEVVGIVHRGWLWWRSFEVVLWVAAYRPPDETPA